MSKQILKQRFIDEIKKSQEHIKKLMIMSNEVASSNKKIKLIIRGKENVLSRRMLKYLATKIVSSDFEKLFKLANNKMSLLYTPVFLTKDTIDFINDAKKDLGLFEGENITDNIKVMLKSGMSDQRSVDSMWYIYSNRMNLHENATINIKNAKEGKKLNRQYIAPDARMKKYLNVALKNLVDSLKKTKHTSKTVNFKKGEDETVESLIDFIIFNYNRIKKMMVRPNDELENSKKNMIRKAANNKVIKTYENIIYNHMIDVELEGGLFLDDNVFLEAAVEVSKKSFKYIDLKGETKTEGEYTLGPYTKEQIENLNVNKKDDSYVLALRAVIDSERNYLTKVKKSN
uniref:Uncharacterized protein n=1 Tax=Pithovirus LCPAC001 TaxID=2506585 RepID=A0A481Z3I5_9VIRU|nr:MAG: hypothetical protein LCPAC001_00490 [Pithovirus LCPAC001]